MTISRTNQYVLGLRATPFFKLSLTVADRAVIEHIQKWLSEQGVRSNLVQRRPHHNTGGSIGIEVAWIEECTKLRDLLDKGQWFAKKEKDFRLWSQALDILNSRRVRVGKRLWVNQDKQTLLDLANIRDRMNLGKHSRKWSSAEIREYIEQRAPREYICVVCGVPLRQFTGNRKYCPPCLHEKQKEWYHNYDVRSGRIKGIRPKWNEPELKLLADYPHRISLSELSVLLRHRSRAAIKIKVSRIQRRQ